MPRVETVGSVVGLRADLSSRYPFASAHPPNIRGKHVALFEEDEAWTAGTVNTTEPFVGIGKQSLKITDSGAGTQADLATTFAWDQAAYPQMEFLFYVDDAAKLSAINIYFGTTSNFTGPFALATSQYSGSASLLAPPLGHWDGAGVRFPPIKTGWNTVRLRTAEFQANGGFVTANWQSIVRLRVKATAQAGQTVNVYFAAIRVVRPPAVIFLDHDDNTFMQANAWAVEEHYGLRSNNFVITSRIGNTGYLTLDQLWGAYSRGHDVCNHTYDHDPRLSLRTDAEKRITVEKGWRDLIGMGFTRSARFFASPGGESSAAITAAVSPFHEVSRPVASQDATMWRKYPNTDKYTEQHRFSSLNNVWAPDFATVKGWIDTAIAQGTMMHLLSHSVSDGGTRGVDYEVDTPLYSQICAYLAANLGPNLRVPTLSEFYDDGVTAVGSASTYSHVAVSPTSTLTLTRKA